MPLDNCPHCNSGHVWVDPIGPAPKPWRWVCGTQYEERTDLCKALGLAECRKRLLAEKDARIASLAAEVERLKAGYRDCLEDLVCCGYQMDDYFQEKYGLDAAVKKHTEALEGAPHAQ